MATAVAHQINQPVGIIRASTSAARSDIEDHLFQTEEIKPLLDKIWQQTERLHKIIDTFRRFARSDRSLQEPVHLNAVIRQTIELFDEQFEQYHIELIPQLTTTDLMVHSNSSLIQEILINLLTNARDALKNQNNATVWITSWQQDNMAHFQVSDNGPGIPETIRPHIFTPFHSTKSTEHGTGLGLYICDKVIKELNGTISYTDRPEGGGCFSITLPQLME
jgi:C4-dicarboxylate-specific signal transduction histidine kinase